MKAAKVTGNPPRESRRRTSVRSTGRGVALPPEARRSTGAALLKHAPGWTGDDLEEVIEIVTRTRVKTRF